MGKTLSIHRHWFMSKVKTLDLGLIKNFIDLIDQKFNGKKWKSEVQAYLASELKTLAEKTKKELPQRARAWISLLEYFGFAEIKNEDEKRIYLTEAGKKISEARNDDEIREIFKSQLLKWQIYPMKRNFEVKVHPFRALIRILKKFGIIDQAELIIIQKTYLSYEDEDKVVEFIKKYRELLSELEKSSDLDFNQMDNRIFIIHQVINSDKSNKMIIVLIKSQVKQFIESKKVLLAQKENLKLTKKIFRDENSILFGKIVNNAYSTDLLEELINIHKMKELKNKSKSGSLTKKEEVFVKNYDETLKKLKSETSFESCGDSYFTLLGYNSYIVNNFLLTGLIEVEEEEGAVEEEEEEEEIEEEEE